jgi:hypothetical protein
MSIRISDKNAGDGFSVRQFIRSPNPNTIFPGKSHVRKHNSNAQISAISVVSLGSRTR